MDHPLTDHLEFLNDICQWSRGRRKIFLEREISETLIAFIVEGIYNVLNNPKTFVAGLRSFGVISPTL